MATIGNVCFLTNDQTNEVLLLKRKNEPMQKMYSGVGGKTKPEEDVLESCIREIREETGLIANKLTLKAVIKTILIDKNSSWVLYVYKCNEYSGNLIDCPEGELKWVNLNDIFKLKLIGFIKEILEPVLRSDLLLEGTIKHDSCGNVLEKNIRKIKTA